MSEAPPGPLSTASHQRARLHSQEAAHDIQERRASVDGRVLERFSQTDQMRHLCIDWPNSSIKGTFAIGASAPDLSPPAFDMPRADVVARNGTTAEFRTRTCTINTTLLVMSGGTEEPAPGGPLTLRTHPAYVHCKSSSGNIMLAVPHYVGREPLHILCETTSGNGAFSLTVSIGLPPSFNGMLSWSTEKGELEVSPGIRARFHRLDSEPRKRHGTAKISADPDAPHWATASGRRGDACEVFQNRGRIYVHIIGESVPHGCTIS